MVLKHNLVGGCPGGWCDYLVQFSEVLVVLLLVDGFIFLVTLIPPLFSWKTKKPDSRRRIFFAAFACLTFYFWLIILAIHSLYCFGFLAHAGPCNSSAVAPTSAPSAPSQLAAPVELQPPAPGLATLNASVGSTVLSLPRPVRPARHPMSASHAAPAVPGHILRGLAALATLSGVTSSPEGSPDAGEGLVS
jgi:hypothetical protein